MAFVAVKGLLDTSVKRGWKEHGHDITYDIECESGKLLRSLCGVSIPFFSTDVDSMHL